MTSKKVLKTAFHSDMLSIDPRKNGDYFSSTIQFMVFRGLMHVNEHKEIAPALAKSYRLSKDKKTYTFHLRDDIFWSDGTKITALDFEKSLKKILSPGFPSLTAQLLYPIKNAEKIAKKELTADHLDVKALDEKTLQINLENPTPYFLFLTSFCTYFPIPSHIEEENPKWLEDPIKYVKYSGPFKLKKWKRGSEIILVKNDKFYDADKIEIDEVHISIVGNEITALNMYEKNEIDFLSSFLSPLPVDFLGTVKKRNDYDLFEIGGSSFCVFNIDKYPFNNQNLRKAFLLSIDRKSITQNITQLNEKIATRCVPPLLTSNKELSFYKDFDIEKAKFHFEKALKELNIDKKDLDLTFTYGSYIIHRKEAEALKSMWEKSLGIQVKLMMFDEASYLAKLHRHDFQMALSRFLVHYNDPMNVLERFKYKKHPKNYANFEDNTFINMLDTANKTINENERIKILEDAERYFIDKAVLAPIYHYNYAIFSKNNVKGIYVGPIGDIYIENAKIIK
ncbi:MAG: Oligopeptide-binding protein OppA [Candidatus Anoxychlamydiales bacterium]|nr:Oligopeptide-binding protein OppA [Candidatus Anoxychlamydiales bacterium]